MLLLHILWIYHDARSTVHQKYFAVLVCRCICLPDDGPLEVQTCRGDISDTFVYFIVLLTVHLSIILVINQLDAQNLVL